MSNLVETEDTTDIRNLTTDRSDSSDFMQIRESDKLQVTHEDILYALFHPDLRHIFETKQSKYQLKPYVTQKSTISNSQEYTLEYFITKKISKLAEVEYIFIFKEQNTFQVWTVIDKLDRFVKDKIYDIEYDILEHFRGTYFNFHVICIEGRGIYDLFPTEGLMFFRGKSR